MNGPVVVRWGRTLLVCLTLAMSSVVFAPPAPAAAAVSDDMMLLANQLRRLPPHGLIVALIHGYLRRAISNVSNIVRYWVYVGVKPVPGMTLESSTAPRLAFAIPILAGTMVMLWLR